MNESMPLDYNLYKTAKEFNKLKPWKWLQSANIYGIKLTGYNQVFFCSVLGHDEQEFGLTIYSDTDGLVKLLESFVKDYKDYQEFIIDQECLAVYFNDRLDLPKDDYDIASISGIPFRGKKQWPAFRKYKPGFLPVRPEEDELFIIQKVMKCSIDIIEAIKQESDNSKFLSEDSCIIREYTSSSEYFDKEIKIEEIVKNYQKVLNIPVAYDEFSLARIKRASKLDSASWEIGYFYYPYAVEQDGVAFYPMNLLLVDTSTQMIVGQHMSPPEKYAEVFQKFILGFFDKNKKMPRQMFTDNEELFYYLDSMFKGLGITLTLVDNLYLIPYIKQDFINKIKQE